MEKKIPKRRPALADANNGLEMAGLPERPRRLRRRLNGVLVPVRLKSATSARNGRAVKVGIVHGAGSRALWGALDGRFAFTKAVNSYRAEYRAHIGEAG